MAKNMARTDDFKTPECRIHYANSLYEPRAVDEAQPDRKKYGCTLIFPLSAKPEFEKILAELIKKQSGWTLDMAKNGLIRSPLLAGDGKEARYKTGDSAGQLKPGMGPDVFFIRVQANAIDQNGKPVIGPWVRWKDPNNSVPYGSDGVYGGCFGKAVVNAYCWDHPKNGAGISFGVSGFQKLREGEPLPEGGARATDPEKWVEKIEDAGPAPEATKDGAGAGGLFG